MANDGGQRCRGVRVEIILHAVERSPHASSRRLASSYILSLWRGEQVSTPRTACSVSATSGSSASESVHPMAAAAGYCWSSPAHASRRITSGITPPISVYNWSLDENNWLSPHRTLRATVSPHRTLRATVSTLSGLRILASLLKNYLNYCVMCHWQHDVLCASCTVELLLRSHWARPRSKWDRILWMDSQIDKTLLELKF
jgi:hypothetical protein